jgi:BirA family biotin operon repressor/biotin-[acetyl-CoA-carboxylase] ligase
VEAWDVIGSTSDRARTLSSEGAPPWTVVVAEEQSAGRGRSGASWHSPARAGLWISTLLTVPPGPLPGHLTLLVGLAAARAVEAVCPSLRVGIKWPNDVFLGRRKLGGILCEQAGGVVVVGVGVNGRQRPEDFPPALATSATSLEAAGCHRVSLGALATFLLSGIRELCGLPQEKLSHELGAEVGERDVLRDLPVSTQQAGNGVARGIGADGALLLERDDGERVRVVAGSVNAW